MIKLFPQNLITTLCLIAGLSLSGQINATQSDLDAELKELIASVDGSVAVQKNALKSLTWKGRSDVQFFDLIEDALLTSYLDVSGGEELDLAAWQAKALSFSGNAKYNKTLSDVAANAPSSKLKRHAANAVSDLPDFEAWNPVISKGLVDAPQGKLDQQRVINMLQSDLPALMTIGAKRVYHRHYLNKNVTDQANDVLLSNYVSASKVQIDGLSWICKALARTGIEEYKVTLQTVATESENRKLARYAKKYAARFGN